MVVEELHLSRNQLRSSSEFCSWLKDNYLRRYVPEDVLKDFGLKVF
jgi:hypothetical protein